MSAIACAFAVRTFPRFRYEIAAIAACCILQAILLARAAWVHSPTWDEIGHLPAGVGHWTFLNFRLYHENPPLVRTIASAPVAGVVFDWSEYNSAPRMRPEFIAGRKFIAEYGEQSFVFFFLARLFCIPLVLLGGIMCWAWARSLFGSRAGLTAAVLWTMSPQIVGHGHLITPDIAAASLGIGAAYFFWRWLQCPSWCNTALAGIALGLAELSKFTWLILFGLWPAAWLIAHCVTRQFSFLPSLFRFAVLMCIAIYIINLGYAFQGTGKPLEEYRFTATVLKGDVTSASVAGNRFRGTLLGRCPMPLPEAYLAGIDAQRHEFERGYYSYLRGQWKDGGWWYYYLYGLGITTPLPILFLLAASVSMLVGQWRTLRIEDGLVLALPPLAVLILVSSHTGFNHHLRYTFPALPFLFVMASRIGSASGWGARCATYGAMAWLSISNVATFPDNMSYFNELVGGPRNGHFYLANSNLDWGQDLRLLKHWIAQNPHAQPLHIAYEVNMFKLEDVGVKCEQVPAGPIMNRPGTPKTDNWPWGEISGDHTLPLAVESADPIELGPRPGWFILGVNRIHRPAGDYEYFLEFEPVEWIGYSMMVFHITLDEANRVRRKLGLPEL